jgi:hypothetical protein
MNCSIPALRKQIFKENICDIYVDTNYDATGADSLVYNYDNRDTYQKRSYLLGDICIKK